MWKRLNILREIKFGRNFETQLWKRSEQNYDACLVERAFELCLKIRRPGLIPLSSQSESR